MQIDSDSTSLSSLERSVSALAYANSLVSFVSKETSMLSLLGRRQSLLRSTARGNTELRNTAPERMKTPSEWRVGASTRDSAYQITVFSYRILGNGKKIYTFFQKKDEFQNFDLILGTEFLRNQGIVKSLHNRLNHFRHWLSNNQSIQRLPASCLRASWRNSSSQCKLRSNLQYAKFAISTGLNERG